MPIDIEALCYAIVETIKIFTPSIIIANALTLHDTKLKLKHLSKAEGNIISMNVPSLKPPIEKKEQTIKTKEFIRPFVRKLVEYTNGENLDNLYRNIQSVKIKKKYDLIAAGSYNHKNNTIEYGPEKAFGHELLHLSSSYYDEENEIGYSGFGQTHKKVSVGRGLNEGYTELLASRIYNKKQKAESYKKEVQIARLFEFFFDNPKDMEKYYFNHDLPGFIHHMENFAPREEIIKILLQVDNIDTYDLVPLNPTPTINLIRTQIKLYDIFKESNPEPEKLEDFRNTIYKHSPMAGMLIDGKTFKLNHSMQKKSTEKYSK